MSFFCTTFAALLVIRKLYQLAVAYTRMLTLNIETSTDVCSAALTDGQRLIASRMLAQGNHAHDLPLFIDSLLTLMRSEGMQLSAVALSAGPGSYTGLRIGTATAKGLCYGYGIPLLAVDTLQLLCASLLGSGFEPSPSQLLCPMIDARRMEVYTALFDSSLNRLSDVEAKVIDTDTYADLLQERQLVFFGNGAAKLKSVITSPNAVFIDSIVPDAKYMGLLASSKLEASDFADLAYFAPFYLKEFQVTVSHKAQDVLHQHK